MDGTVDNTKVDNTKMGRFDYLILTALTANQADSHITAITIKEIIDFGVTVKRPTVYKYLHNLMLMGYVKEAGKCGKEIMYYVTESGMKIVGGK